MMVFAKSHQFIVPSTLFAPPIKRILRGLPKPPTTVEQLQAAILAAWEGLAIEDINKHVNRMSDRVEAVAKAKGGHTRF